MIVPIKVRLEGINGRGQDKAVGWGAEKGEGVTAAGVKVEQLRGAGEGPRVVRGRGGRRRGMALTSLFVVEMLAPWDTNSLTHSR